MPTQIQTQTENFYKAIQEFVTMRDALVQDVPKKVLQTIQGSINPTKGKAGELVVYMKLFSAYSRIFAFGKPIDFIGIKDDSLDFIEVKTGKARLTAEEKKLRDLIIAKKINFITVYPELSIQPPHDITDTDEDSSPTPP
jgi:predicted Holliday junction resolvase-like endonuclease